MHDTAFEIGAAFIEVYGVSKRRVILEIGSLDVNGSLRSSCPDGAMYLGVDIQHGAGVDIVVNAAEPLPIRSDFSDLTISTSQMEHDPRFWSTFLELCRVTKKGGFIYLSAPSNGPYHAYPVDVWRFYPDAGKALASWARDNGHEITLLESFTAPRSKDIWNDFIAIFYMGEWRQGDPIIFLSDRFAGVNTWQLGATSLRNSSASTEDNLILEQCRAKNRDLIERLQASDSRIAGLELEVEELKTKMSSANCGEAAQEADVYNQDGLRTIHNHDFIGDPDFARAYARGVTAVGADYQWHWRVHVGVWAAECAIAVEGDFVECGVNRGFLSSAIMNRLDWNSRNRTFYLLDTFYGVDLRYLSETDRTLGVEERAQRELDSGFYATSSEEVRANFSEWPNATIIEGPIPETLPQVNSKAIAFLHLDLNCSMPEIAALSVFWDRLSPGAIVLMDDYAYKGYESQKMGIDGFARVRSIPVLSLPTGQGLIIKPRHASLEPNTERWPAMSLPKSCLAHLQQGHLNYQYRGIETLKCPFDLALYALLIWNLKPRTIIEIGSNKGGSAIWLADQLRAYGIDGHVWSYDVHPVNNLHDDLVTFGFADAERLEDALTQHHLDSLPRPFLVIEDCSHQRVHSLAVMAFFESVLQRGEYMIVEDAIVTDLGMADLFDGGPKAAISEFLASHETWHVDRFYCDFFGPNVTWNVDGYLKKTC